MSIFPSQFIESPQIAKFSSIISQPKGSLFALFCNVLIGSKPLLFQWFKNGNQIPIANNKKESSFSSSVLDGRFQIDTKAVFSQLMLHDLVATDSGNYSCIVSNEHGFDTQWSMLQVKGLVCFRNK